MKRKLLTFAITAAMLITTAVPAGFCYAETSEGDQPAVLDGETIDGMTEDEVDADSVMGSDVDENTEHFGAEGDGGSSLMAKSSKAWAKKSAGVWYNGYGKATLKGAVAKGIDVSRWQGKIDWAKVQNDGIDFAIIRLGWGSDDPDQDDSKLKYNVQQCEKYGIPYGFYLYSYANTSTKNEREIKHVLRLLKGTHPTYPVYYDIEDKHTNGTVSPATLRSYCVNFCKKVKAAGYIPGVYASLSWWNSKLSTSALDPYERWVAQWNSTGCTYKRSWYLWQCADDYHVSGISGRVDLNFAYKKFAGTKTSSPSTTATTSSKKRQFVTSNGAKYYYDSNGYLAKNGWIHIKDDYYYATASGAIYRNTYQKIGNYYYGFDSNGARYNDITVKIDGKDHHFNRVGKAYLCVRYATANLNKRSGPGQSYKVQGMFKQGDMVRVVRKSGTWWQDTNGSWVSSDYLASKKEAAAQETSTKASTGKATYKKVGNYYYGFDKNGKKYKNVTVKINGKRYHFNKAGQAYLYNAKTTANLNKRSGPGTSYATKGLVKEGNTVYIVRKSGVWWQETNGSWLHSDYLKVTRTYPY